MRELFYSFLIFCFIFTIFSCGQTTEENIGSAVSKTNDTVNDASDAINNTLFGGTAEGSCEKNAFIVGNLVSEKGCYPNCKKNKAVNWNLCEGKKSLGDSSGVVDATGHNGSIYIADDGGFYWIVGNSIEKHQLNYSSGYKLSEVTGIDVNSNGDVYVAGMVQKNKKEYTAYWKNGELVKWFRHENNDWYSEKNVAADSNGNVYIPGWWMRSHTTILSTYWKNGNLKKLTNSYDAEATDVDIRGGKVYFSGAHGPICDLPCPVTSGTLAAYWIGGKMTKVTKVKTAGYPKKWIMRSRASSIHVEGSKVYMAGDVDGFVPVYWKNKIQHELQVEYNLDTCDYCTAEPIDISVVGGKVLVAGYYNHIGGGYRGAVYWLDKKLYKLCEDCDSSDAVAVVVLD